ncbi:MULTISPECIES: XRE family transcriptional regulator [Actinomadura]|uniref:HTH cro/C1-type domain-containing protein n=1 Tax=Actinomadura yumaensis TaxID=111807 RepID=A0ABW2CLF7_9ACTN|nr:XRE family transcriptional regulator [Actinomadura sp. J1-007]MWK37132.1 XRE family transcriptional regulator [Actinomadura sp. J1-007]
MSVGQAPKTLAEKINWLIRHMWPPDVKPATSDAEVAAALQRVTGEDISRSTVWKLRTSRQPNPTLRTLTTLATFFRVPIGYFGEGSEAESIEDQLTLLALMRDGGVDTATLRTLADLSPEGRRMIGEMIASAARMEQHRSTQPHRDQTDR